MAELCGVICNLDLCVGCCACEVACKQENQVPPNTKWIKVIPIGPEELAGKLTMDFVPMMTDECTLCEHRFHMNLEPRCVENCPTGGLEFCKNATEVLSARGETSPHLQAEGRGARLWVKTLCSSLMFRENLTCLMVMLLHLVS